MDESFEVVGTGLTVFTDDQPVEGPLRWLDSPQAVLEFVSGDNVADTIVLARGGTTTFLTPALTAGVKGVVTLQGAPESHLGILSREYGIPCVMGVGFTKGVRSARGEIIPADGAVVALDISSFPDGRILAEPGAPTIEDWDGPTPAVMDAETLAQVQLLLTKFGGEIPHGAEGDAQIRAGMKTGVLHLTDETLRRDLTVPEVNELVRYANWNLWDCLAARATEGESGLIPRQEYESVSWVQIWQRYPEFIRFITDEIGVDGVIELGAVARAEIGTKINTVHQWALSLAVAVGRAIALNIGLCTEDHRTADIAAAFQFQRRLYRGLWGTDGAGMYGSMNGYTARLLGDEWLERFSAERTVFEDPEQRGAFQRFSAGTELMGFLLHMDCRAGLSDTGPYPSADGGFVIVRDHFFTEDVYQWGQLADGLPYCVTEAMFFAPDEPLDVAVLDIGTMFTQPPNYLKHLKGAAVYVRDRWDTPIGDVRLIDDAEMGRIEAACGRGTARLYPHIAAMSKREKIMAGAKVYYTDFILPYARRAGLFDRMVDEFDFFEWDPVASEAYYRLVRDGTAAELVPRLFLTGTLAGALPEPEAEPEPEAAVDAEPGPAVDADPAIVAALYPLSLRGSLAVLPDAAAGAEAAGLVLSTRAGWMLTPAGLAACEAAAAAERAGLDVEALRPAYERFLAVNSTLKSVAARWADADKETRYELLGQLDTVIGRAGPALRSTAEALPRFDGYVVRLTDALEKAFAGDHDFAVSPLVESLHTVWMEIHEDYLRIQGISRKEEGSY